MFSKGCTGYIYNLTVFTFWITGEAQVFLFFQLERGTKITNNAVPEMEVGDVREMQGADSVATECTSTTEVQHEARDENRCNPGRGM